MMARGGVASASVLAFLGAGLGYASQVLVARLAGPSGFGTYSFVLGLVAMAQPWLALDFGAAIVRFVPGYASVGNVSLIRRMVWRSTQIIAGTSVIAAASIAAVLYWKPPADVTPSALWFGLVNAALNVSLLLTGQFLTSMRRASAAILLAQVLRPALAIAALLVLANTPTGAERKDLLGLSAAAIALIVVLMAGRRILDQTLAQLVTTPDARAQLPTEQGEGVWYRYAGTFLFGSIAQTLISQQVDIVIVGAMVATVDAGHYAAASQIAVAMGIVPGVINSLLSPRYASAHDREQRTERDEVMRHFIVLLLGIALVGLAGVTLMGPLVLRLYGASFGASLPIALLLSSGAAVSALLGMPASLALSTRGHHRQQNVALVLTAVIAVTLSVTFTARYGAVGAAVATLTTAIIRGCILQGVCRYLEPGSLQYRTAIGAALRNPRSILAEVFPGSGRR